MQTPVAAAENLNHQDFWVRTVLHTGALRIYSPYAKVFVKMSVRHPCDAMLQYKFINYTTTTTRIVSKIKLQSL